MAKKTLLVGESCKVVGCTKVLVFGSLNIDYVYSVDHFLQKGETQSSKDLQVFAGGKGLNQSVSLAKAGARVYLAGSIGKDGLFLKEMLEEAGVAIDYIDIRDDVRSGNAIIQVDKDGHNCILLYGGANQTTRKEHIDEVLENFNKGDFLILQNEINEMNYLIKQAKKRELLIFLNPSPMNELINDYPLESIDYLLLNEIEASQMIGEELDLSKPDEIVTKLYQKYPYLKIVLTLGSDGSIYKDANQMIHQKCYPVDVVDTTAAGDTYTGFFVASIMGGLDLKEAMDMAAKASSITVSRAGAAQSIPRWDEVINLG